MDEKIEEYIKNETNSILKAIYCKPKKERKKELKKFIYSLCMDKWRRSKRLQKSGKKNDDAREVIESLMNWAKEEEITLPEKVKCKIFDFAIIDR